MFTNERSVAMKLYCLADHAASLAIIFLTRKHEEVPGFTWFHRLLFQVVSNKPDRDPQHGLQEQGQDKSSLRDPTDDERLIQARKLLIAYNSGRDERNPGVLILFPPVIEVSELPSSRSRGLGSMIPKDEF
ncbi:hypothetical protein F4818DRAFT_446750 [Hypoxylon cercidicola]|nr:hypothetical protein F4818DRAFT_446750 [Hypoxylon cercidicola]